MTGTIVDDVLAGRRFPYSRAWARAGFSADDAERWRRAGWDVAEDAAVWYRIPTDAGPVELMALALAGFEPDDVRRVSRFAPTLTAAWTRALVLPTPTPDPIDVEIDLREVESRARVRENLLR